MPSYTQAQARREARDAAVQRLGYADYRDYLQSPEWARVRERAAAHHGYYCQCGSTQRLNLHHTTYERVGQEHMADVIWLCGTCHQDVHTLERRGLGTLTAEHIVIDTERAAVTKPAREAMTARQRAEFHSVTGRDARDEIRRRLKANGERMKRLVAMRHTVDAALALSEWLDQELRKLEGP